MKLEDYVPGISEVRWTDIVSGRLRDGDISLDEETQTQLQHRNISQMVFYLKKIGSDYQVTQYIPANEFSNYKP